jgi:hypothetical protein
VESIPEKIGRRVDLVQRVHHHAPEFIEGSPSKVCVAFIYGCNTRRIIIYGCNTQRIIIYGCYTRCIINWWCPLRLHQARGLPPWSASSGLLCWFASSDLLCWLAKSDDVRWPLLTAREQLCTHVLDDIERSAVVELARSLKEEFCPADCALGCVIRRSRYRQPLSCALQVHWMATSPRAAAKSHIIHKWSTTVVSLG